MEDVQCLFYRTPMCNFYNKIYPKYVMKLANLEKATNFCFTLVVHYTDGKITQRKQRMKGVFKTRLTVVV